MKFLIEYQNLWKNQILKIRLIKREVKKLEKIEDLKKLENLINKIF